MAPRGARTRPRRAPRSRRRCRPGCAGREQVRGRLVGRERRRVRRVDRGRAVAQLVVAGERVDEQRVGVDVGLGVGEGRRPGALHEMRASGIVCRADRDGSRASFGVKLPTRDVRPSHVLRPRPMIDFGLSEEQEALQRSAREFLARECPPALVRETARTDDGVPRDLYRKMAELGWMGLIVPEKEGGLGLGALDLALVMEELGRVAAPGPFLATQLVIAGLLRAGTAAQRAAWLPRLIDGTAFATLAHLEESDRHDP